MSGQKIKCQDAVWVGQYHRLIRDGFKPKSGATTCVDIAEATVDRYEQYQNFLEEITHTPVPWMFPSNPTPEEAALIQKMDKAILKLKSEMGRFDLSPESKEYQKTLFMGLYLFAFVPSGKRWEHFQKRSPSQFENIMKRLWANGLKEFADTLTTEGGLGLGFIDEDLPVEGSGLEILLKGKGLCTEKNKIFYTLARRAGLKPVMVHMTASDFYRHFRELFGNALPFMLPPEEALQGHVTTALPLGKDETQYAEFNLNGYPWIDTTYAPYARELSLREFYQADISNRIGNTLETETPARLDQWFEGGLALGDSSISYLLELLLASRALENNNLDLFLIHARKALEQNPNFAPPLPWVTATRDETLFSEFETRLKKMAEKDFSLNYPLALAYYQRNRHEESLAAAQKALDGGYKDPGLLNLMGTIEEKRGNWNDAVKHLELSIAMNPAQPPVHGHLAAALKEAGEKTKAYETFQKALVLFEPGTPEHFQVLCCLAGLAAELQKSNEAGNYFALALKHPRRNTSFDIGSYSSLLEASKTLEKTKELAEALEAVLLEQPTEFAVRAAFLNTLWFTDERDRVPGLLNNLVPFIRQQTENLVSMDPEIIDPERVKQMDAVLQMLDPEVIELLPDLFPPFREAIEKYHSKIGAVKKSPVDLDSVSK